MATPASGTPRTGIESQTTTQVYEALSKQYSQKQKPLDRALGSIDTTRRKIDTRYEDLQNKRITIPAKQDLIDERDAFWIIYNRFQSSFSKAIKLKTGLEEGVNYLNTPLMEAQTLETIRRRDPEKHTKILEDQEKCNTQLTDLRDWQGHMTTVCNQMDKRMNNLGYSLKFFFGVVGSLTVYNAPLSSVQRGRLQLSSLPDLSKEVDDNRKVALKKKIKEIEVGITSEKLTIALEKTRESKKSQLDKVLKTGSETENDSDKDSTGGQVEEVVEVEGGILTLQDGYGAEDEVEDGMGDTPPRTGTPDLSAQGTDTSSEASGDDSGAGKPGSVQTTNPTPQPKSTSTSQKPNGGSEATGSDKSGKQGSTSKSTSTSDASKGSSVTTPIVTTNKPQPTTKSQSFVDVARPSSGATNSGTSVKPTMPPRRPPTLEGAKGGSTTGSLSKGEKQQSPTPSSKNKSPTTGSNSPTDSNSTTSS